MKRVLAAVLALTMALGMGAVPVLAAADVAYGFEETVLVDNDDIKVTATGFEPDQAGRPTFSMLYENKTDRDLHFAVMESYLNGRKCDGYGSEDVAAGKQAYGDMYWYEDDLAENGVNYIDDVMIDLWVYEDGSDIKTVFEDTVSWSANAVSDVPALADLTFDSGFEEIPILSGDYTAVVKDFDPDGPWDDGEPSFVVYLANDTKEDVMFVAEKVSVNGTMCDPVWGRNLEAGTSIYDYYFSWTEDDLAAAHIESFETVEFELVVDSTETYEELAREPVTVDLAGLGAIVAAPAEGANDEIAQALEEDAARAAAEEGLTEEPAEEPAEEAPAEETAEKTAGPVDVAALAGSLDPDDPVYSNTEFGMTCSFDPNWRLLTEEQLAAHAGWDETSGTDPVEYLGQYLADGNSANLMYLISEDGSEIAQITVNAYSGAGELENSKDAAGRNLFYFDISGESMLEGLGMQNCEMSSATAEIDGVEYSGIHFAYDDVNAETGETTPGSSLWLFLVRNDYERDQDYVMTIRLISLGEDRINEMLGMLTMPAED